MLWKIWLENSDFNFSLIIEEDSLETAILKARELSMKYSARIKAVDCIHSLKPREKTKKSREGKENQVWKVQRCRE